MVLYIKNIPTTNVSRLKAVRFTRNARVNLSPASRLSLTDWIFVFCESP